MFFLLFMFTFLFSYWWAIVYFPVSSLYYVIVSFICITTTPSIFMFLCFFSFLLLLFFLLFKQIKRFLLNMQAIVSSPSHDFTLSQLHTVCVCTLCVSVCVLIQIRSPDICVSTWSWTGRSVSGWACLSTLCCHLRSSSVQTSPSCPACLWVLLSRLVVYID